LELWRAKFEIAGSAPEGFVDKNFIRKEIWGLNEDECDDIDDARKKDKIVDQGIESAGAGGEGGDMGGGEDLFGGGGEGGDLGGEEAPPEENAGEEPEEEVDPGTELLTSGDDYDDFESFQYSLKELDSPINIRKTLKETNLVVTNKRNSKRRKKRLHHTDPPDFPEMLSARNRSFNDVTGLKSVIDSVSKVESRRQQEQPVKTNLPHDLLSALNRWRQSHGLSTTGLLKESEENVFFVDGDDET
jgi:hypothetical protein